MPRTMILSGMRRLTATFAFLIPLLLHGQPPSADSLAYSINQFGFDYFRTALQQSGPDAPVLCAPYSLHSLLCLLAEGSSGSTETLLKKQLHLPSPGARQDGLQAMQFYLNQPHMACTLSAATAIWPAEGLSLSPDYTQRIQQAYQQQVRELPFAKDPLAARTFINQWVAERTHDRVTALLPEEAISPLTQVVLTNAVHFKGPWAQQFAVSATREDIFFLADGGTIPVQYMHQPHGAAPRRYGEHQGAQLVELAFEGDELAMTFILPNKEDPHEWCTRLDAQTWREMQEGMWETEIELWLPKFELANGGSLRSTLSTVGLAPIFSGVELKRMFAEVPPSIKVSDVFGKNTLKIEEGGAEASSTAAIVVQDDIATDSDAPPASTVFKADRPFLAVLHHKPSGVILSIARVADPSRKPD